MPQATSPASPPASPPSASPDAAEPAAPEPPSALPAAFWAAIGAGRAQVAAAQYEAAILSYTAALEAVPSHPRALSGRGHARLLAGQLDAAEDDLRAARAAPSTRKLEAAIVFNLGLIAERRGDAARARERFSVAHALNPGKATAQKLAGGSRCPLEIERGGWPSRDYTGWLELWNDHGERKTRSDEPVEPPTDDASAYAKLCTETLRGSYGSAIVETCDGKRGGPRLARLRGPGGGIRVLIIVPDGDRALWVTDLGLLGGNRCSGDTFTALQGQEPVHVHIDMKEWVDVDMRVDEHGRFVECEGEGECFPRCGDEDISQFIDMVFPEPHATPLVIRGPFVPRRRGGYRPAAEISIDGDDIVISGPDCASRVPLRAD